jgi:hypothetical protein
MFLYIFVGAAALSSSEGGWTFGEAFYFCFVSILTVGYGGLRPQDSNLWPCVVYIFFGMAVVSTCFYILRQDVFDQIGKFRVMELRRKE